MIHMMQMRVDLVDVLYNLVFVVDLVAVVVLVISEQWQTFHNCQRGMYCLDYYTDHDFLL